VKPILFVTRPLVPLYPLLIVLLTLTSGCAALGLGWKKKPLPSALNAILVEPSHREIGRILSFDPLARTALVQLPYFAFSGPALASGTPLIARHLDSLEMTARLVVTPYRMKSIMAVYVVEGVPNPGDEVALPLD
jgi:hypothetical protein